MAKKCKVCGTSYEYCPSCSRDALKPNWMLMFHNENCKNIFETLQKHFIGEYSDEKANEVLSKLNLSVKDKMDEEMKKQLQYILDRKKIVNRPIKSNKK